MSLAFCRPFLVAQASFGRPTTIPANPTEEMMNVKRITPVLFVKEIEPVLPFWVDALGFAKNIEVPHGNTLGFVALQKGTTEVMYQSYASLGEDMPLVAEAARKGPTFLYIEVDNLDAVLMALQSFKIVQPERTAFYGMREVGYQDPAGHFVTFAQAVAATH
jgi:uncharacterized glyoxalase superfamily protein PhnB